MSELQRLMDRCKCGVYLTVNQHRDYYQTAAEALAEAAQRECPPEIDADVRAHIVAADTLIELQFYPDSPVSSYEVVHYELGLALAAAHALLDRDRNE